MHFGKFERGYFGGGGRGAKCICMMCVRYNIVLLQDLEERLKSKSEELAWHREKAADIENKYLVLEREISHHCIMNLEETSQQNQVMEDLLSLKKRLASENEAHCNFLQTLLDLIAHESPSTAHSPSAPKWGKLSASVLASIESVLASLQCCKTVLERQHLLLEDAAQMHEEALSRLALEKEERERQWEHRLAELKRNYEMLLMERDGEVSLNPPIQASRDAITSEHSEQLKKPISKQEQSNSDLTSQLAQLKEIHKVYKNDRACLLSCVSLMTVSCYSALNRIQQLCFQKHALVHLLGRSHQAFRSRTGIVEGSEPQNSAQPPIKVLRLKVIAIVVLAANRLQQLRTDTAQFFKSNFPMSETGLCWTTMLPHIGLKPSRSGLTARGCVLSDVDLARWLRSEQVLVDARRCFSGLQATLDSYTCHPHPSSRKPAKSGEGKKLRRLVLQSHSDFIAAVSAYFQ